MQKSHHFVNNVFLYLFLLIPYFVFGGGWVKIHEDPGFNPVNDAISLSYDLNTIYAAGDGGMLYFSYDWGKTWGFTQLEGLKNLYGLDFANQPEEGIDSPEAQVTGEPNIVVCGQDGTLFLYNVSNGLTTPIDTLTTLTLNSVHFDYSRGKFWVVGDSNFFAYSEDQGYHWYKIDLRDPVSDIKDFISDYNFLILFGDDGSNLYIKNLQAQYGYPLEEMQTDTLYEQKFVAVKNFENGWAYLITRSTTSEESYLYQLNTYYYPESAFEQIAVLPFTDPSGIGHYQDYTAETDYMWVSTKSGEIWESMDQGYSWKLVFKDPEGRSLGPIVTAGEEGSVKGIALGSGGLVLMNGFKVFELEPRPGEYIRESKDYFTAQFSYPPDLESLRRGVFVKSNYSSLLPFDVELDPLDSTKAIFKILREFPYGSIPGEIWNITFSGSIYAKGDSANQTPLSPFNYSLYFTPWNAANFNFELSENQAVFGNPSTNWVSGFFNSDDLLDLITFSQDTLVCYYQTEVATDSIAGQIKKIPFSDMIIVTPNIKKQLKVADVNHDSRPDLIVYDNNGVYLLVNNSAEGDISFYRAEAFYRGSNIRQVIPYNDNSDLDLDLMVLGDDILVLSNVSEVSIAQSITTIYYGATGIGKIGLGDVNGDLAEDLVYLIDGSLIVRYGDPRWGISGSYVTDTLAVSDYFDFTLGNLDNDNRADVIALAADRLDALSLSFQNKGTPAPAQNILTFNDPEIPVVDVLAQDLGRNPTTDYFNIMDIALIKGDSLLIYKNETKEPGNFVFKRNPEFSLQLYKHFNLLQADDMNRDSYFELILTDTREGSFRILERPKWIPKVTVTGISSYRVDLEWTPLPDEYGTIEYYKIFRSRTPEVSTDSYIRFSNDPFFTDDEVSPFEDFWYQVQAVYSGGLESELSDPVPVSTYFELNGNVTGVIADTTLPYWAKSNIFVPVPDSLKLINGVEIGFNAGAGLHVYGKFQVQGIDDNRMVNFYAVHKNEGDSLWDGIYFYQGTDTIFMQWFDIYEAKTALQTKGRPFKIRLGGLTRSYNGIVCENTDYWAENVIIDSTMTGILAGDNTNGYLKNINILRTAENSIAAKGLANVWIKNAIIWGNEGPVTASDSAKIRIMYSTVDSIGSNVFTEYVSELPPVFDPSDADMSFKIDVSSPTIDAGDPNDDFSQEPEPNGGRINQGVLGGTPMATPSLQPRINLYAVKSPLRAHPDKVDSTLIFVKNWGFVDLNVQSIGLKNSTEQGPFKLGPFTKNIIPPADSVSVKIYFTPQKRAQFKDTLIVKCNDPHLPGGITEMPVFGLGLNSKPKLMNSPPTVAFVDSLYKFKPVVFDFDGDSVAITPTKKPAWLTWTDSLTLTGIPALSDTGKHEVVLNLNDLHGGVDSVRYFIDVLDLEVPIVITPVIKVFPVGGQISRQAAMKFVISVSDSSEQSVKVATSTYRFFYTLKRVGEEKPFIAADTSGIKEIVFYPLKDGDYIFGLRAFKTIPRDRVVQATSFTPFVIRASKGSINRFRWSMISFPRPKVFSWSQLNYSDSAAVLFRWEPSEKKYRSVKREEILPGWAFWILPLIDLQLDLNNVPLDTSNVETETPQTIPVKPGWNQIGLSLPYYQYWMDFKVKKSDDQEILTVQQAIDDSLLMPAVYWFEQTIAYQGYHVQEVDSGAFAVPWRGYWLYSRGDLTLIPPGTPAFPFIEANQILKKSKTAEKREKQNVWAYNLTVKSGSFGDDFNVIGLTKGKPSELLEPPYFNEYCALSINKQDLQLCKLVKTFPRDVNQVTSWNITVKTSFPGKNHVLKWEAVGSNDEQLYVYLIDLAHEKVINMNDISEYSFTPDGPDYQFRVYASRDNNFKPSIIPLQFKLSQNFPNPFNPSTTIKIGIPETGAQNKIVLKIYDVLGKEIKSLFEGNLPPGYHQFEWDGTNQTGNAVASGIYFYQLQAGKTSIMRKMILLR
ncbi:MAG: T9SS type A sorting domain-containing protein [Calditrichaeota bacterium]|nr:T9SS type A sorting domain-containing protein [Calditrichota bacterium]